MYKVDSGILEQLYNFVQSGMNIDIKQLKTKKRTRCKKSLGALKMHKQERRDFEHSLGDF